MSKHLFSSTPYWRKEGTALFQWCEYPPTGEWFLVISNPTGTITLSADSVDAFSKALQSIKVQGP